MSSEPESAYFFPSVNVFIVPSVKLTVTFLPDWILMAGPSAFVIFTPFSVNINFFRVRKSAKNGVKQRLAEISGAGGGRDALKFKIDASGGSDYNQRRQKK